MPEVFVRIVTVRRSLISSGEVPISNIHGVIAKCVYFRIIMRYVKFLHKIMKIEKMKEIHTDLLFEYKAYEIVISLVFEGHRLVDKDVIYTYASRYMYIAYLY